jgi:hypothetical protein
MTLCTAGVSYPRGAYDSCLCSSLCLHLFMKTTFHRLECGYPQDATTAAASNRYLCLWANKRACLAEMVLPVFSDSWSPTSLQYIGFSSAVPQFKAPLSQQAHVDLSEEQDLLLHHYRLFVAHVGQLLCFSIQHQSPPWCWVAYLEALPGHRGRILASMKKFWETVMILETSTDRAHRALSQQLAVKACKISH